FVGALYLDQGLEAVRAFLERYLFTQLPSNDRGAPLKDFKTELQEKVQQLALGPIDYRIIEERGPAHDREFVAEVSVGERKLGQGGGRSKKEAEQQAASKALLLLADETKR